MNPKKSGYWGRLLSALLGKTKSMDDTAGLQARIATLEMDLREQQERIGRMKKEYTSLDANSADAARHAGHREVEKMFQKLTGPLSNLLSLTALAEAGKDVQMQDLVQLIRSLEKALSRLGLEAIGQPGQDAVFDVQMHQRMSGGAVREGSPVTVQLPGFRLGDKILIKAMVSSKEVQ